MHWASDKKDLAAVYADPSGRQYEKRKCCGAGLYVMQRRKIQRVHLKGDRQTKSAWSVGISALHEAKSQTARVTCTESLPMSQFFLLQQMM